MICRLSSVVSLLFFLSAANAHALLEPALGVKGAGARSDVTRPSAAAPCGAGVNVASVLASSTAVTASAAGVFTVTAQNFNAGTDGSREVTSAKVDATGTGAASSFTGTATVTTNGIKSPTDVTSQQLTLSLPAGTKCAGGADKASCLVSLTTAGGFGNCVLVSQGAGAAAAAGGAAATAASTGSTASTAAAAGAGAAAGGAAAAAASTTNKTTGAGAAAAATGKKHHHKAAKAGRAYGARLPRALLALAHLDME